MSKLNRDIIYLILKDLQNEKKTLNSCLSVNKTWCEIIIPILWKDPWKYLKDGSEDLLLNIIISHLSDKSKDNLSQHFNTLIISYQKPLYNYINFCTHLNFYKIKMMIDATIDEESEISIIKNEIFNLFINRNNIKFTHLYIPRQFDYQINLTESCFSDLEFLSCSANINENILSGLTEICKSIKELELFIEGHDNNYGIVRLIETPKKLLNIRLLTTFDSFDSEIDESLCKIIESSLIKHENTIQYFTITDVPITKILSSFVNLKRLELELYDSNKIKTWNCLSLSKHLTEIDIDYAAVGYNEINNKRIIQVIYQNCPNLKYLRLLVIDSDILELEKLLINCQYLDGLYIVINSIILNWEGFFRILTKSSPISLFKFKLYFINTPNLESLKLFFDNWKGRHPMLLQTAPLGDSYSDLLEKYKAEGIIKKYDYTFRGDFEDFEWIQRKMY